MSHPLIDIGVRDDLISFEEKVFLDTQGYLSLGPLLAPKQLEALRNRTRELLQAEGEMGGSELLQSERIRHPRETGADRLANLVNKGAIFDSLYTHPKLLAAVVQVLGPEIKLSSLNYRAAKPGEGLQKLHVDWPEAVSPNAFTVCNSIWLLDDFTVNNGATRLVPGTHLSGAIPEQVMTDPLQPHPEETILVAPAGTVVVFNSHLWHGGTINQTSFPRRAIHCYYCRRDQPQQSDQRELIRTETRARLSTEALWLLDV